MPMFSLQVQGTGNMAAVCIKQEHLVKVFSHRVIDLLTAQPDKSIPVPKFVTAYEKLHNNKLRVQNFGFASLDELLSTVSAVAKVNKLFQPCFHLNEQTLLQSPSHFLEQL